MLIHLGNIIVDSDSIQIVYESPPWSGRYILKLKDNETLFYLESQQFHMLTNSICKPLENQ